MSRGDIGSYLGQKPETVCRMLAKLQQKGLISVEQKCVRILDNAGLERVLNRDLN
jgi:Mn-dependent DtxR family transcriptional regulator